MAGLTLAQAETNLAVWVSASEAVALNQSYSIAGRSMTRADAEDILKMIEYWNGQIQRLTRTRARTRYVVPQ